MKLSPSLLMPNFKAFRGTLPYLPELHQSVDIKAIMNTKQCFLAFVYVKRIRYQHTEWQPISHLKIIHFNYTIWGLRAI